MLVARALTDALMFLHRSIEILPDRARDRFDERRRERARWQRVLAATDRRERLHMRQALELPGGENGRRER